VNKKQRFSSGTHLVVVLVTFTILPMVVVATARALREFPRMNASVAGDGLVVRKEINIGVAVDTEEGLLVPVIHRAQDLDLFKIVDSPEESVRTGARVRATLRRVRVDGDSGQIIYGYKFVVAD
jgi:pyruvate/2-oxoglutarate dehydrogenase complex dihydrolipoamide acyltransferase (E2) component